MQGLTLILAGALLALSPLPVPEDFDATVSMIGDGQHAPREAAEFAEELLANGAPEDIALAVKVLDATLACQEMREGARHHGNFLWNREDDAIRDLNSVEFVLRYMIPMMIRHGDRLPADMQDRVLRSIQAGLNEIRRMDVAVTYTNIAAMDCANSALGGELLRDTAIATRGYEKLKALSDITAQYGTVYEFYSPGYTQVTVDALHRLASLTTDEPTRIRARTMIARLALTTALHVHEATGRLAGPFSRAYHDQVLGKSEAESVYLRRWVAEGVVPDWTTRILDRDMPLPMTIAESSYPPWDMGMTCYIARNYSLGVATREISNQTSGVIARYPVADSGVVGTVFSRYILNGTFFETPGEGESRNVRYSLNEDGKLWAVQNGPGALCLYAPRNLVHPDSFAPCSQDRWRSAKAAVIWSRRDTVEGIWAGDRRIDSLPADVEPNTPVAVLSGPIYVGILPVSRTDLGYGAPLRLSESEGYLAFQMYNYLGGEKLHNDLEPMSRFYRGQPQCGFYLEVAEREEYPDGAAFAAAIASGSLHEDVAPESTAYMTEAFRPWTVEYRRGDQTTGLTIDLMNWTLTRRWTQDGDVGYPSLESPVARQTDTGRVEVGGARVECSAAPAWLYADPGADLYVAGYHGPPGPFALITPTGRVELRRMGTGTVVYDAGTISVDALHLQQGP